MRYFIFFYKVVTYTGHYFGQHGNAGELLPSNKHVTEMIVKHASQPLEAGQINITGFNEVTEEDYDNWFGI